MTSRLAVRRAGAVLLCLSVPMVAWWLIGDQSESPVADDYALHPLDIRFGDERVFGVVAAVVGAVGLVVLVRSRGTLRSAPTAWELAVAGVAAAEVLSALIYRVATAGVVGANIGAGMMFIFVVPVVGYVLAWSLGRVGALGAPGGRQLPIGAVVVGLTVVHYVAGMTAPWSAPAVLALACAVVTFRVLTAAQPGTASGPIDR